MRPFRLYAHLQRPNRHQIDRHMKSNCPDSWELNDAHRQMRTVVFQRDHSVKRLDRHEDKWRIGTSPNWLIDVIHEQHEDDILNRGNLQWAPNARIDDK